MFFTAPLPQQHHHYQHMVHVWSWVVSINVDVDGGDGRHCPRANLAASASSGRVWSLGLVWQLLGACEYRHHQHHVFTIVFIILIYFYLAQVWSLPCLVSKSLRPSVLVVGLDMLHLSNLLHGFLQVVTWICQIWCMDFSRMLHGFVKIDTWICHSCMTMTCSWTEVKRLLKFWIFIDT